MNAEKSGHVACILLKLHVQRIISSKLVQIRKYNLQDLVFATNGGKKRQCYKEFF